MTLPKIDRYPVLASGKNFNDNENPVFTITAYNTYPLRVKLEAGGDSQLIKRDLSTKSSTTYTLVLTSEERQKLKDLTTGDYLNVRYTVCAMSGNTELSSSYKDYKMYKTSRPIRLMVNGQWKDSVPYVRVNGQWKECTPYVRINGQWKEGN